MSKKISVIGNAAKDPDNVIRNHIGECESVLIISYDTDGDFCVAASTNINKAEINWMIDHAKAEILGLVE